MPACRARLRFDYLKFNNNSRRFMKYREITEILGREVKAGGL